MSKTFGIVTSDADLMDIKGYWLECKTMLEFQYGDIIVNVDEITCSFYMSGSRCYCSIEVIGTTPEKLTHDQWFQMMQPKQLLMFRSNGKVEFEICSTNVLLAPKPCYLEPVKGKPKGLRFRVVSVFADRIAECIWYAKAGEPLPPGLPEWFVKTQEPMKG